MDANQLSQGKVRGGVILRMVGLAVLLVGLHGLLGVLSLVVPSLRHLPTVSGPRNQGYILGVWLVEGWWAELASALLGVLYLFGGFQLLRLRWSGWVVATLLLGYASLSIALWWVTGQFEGQLEKAVTAAREPGLVALLGTEFFVKEHQADIERVYRLAGFLFALHCVPFLYLTTEWRRFWAKEDGGKAPRGSASKAVLGLVVVGGSAVWAFWGAEYAHYRRALEEAGSPTPNLAAEQVSYLSLTHRRQVTAMLVRQLVAEQTDALAEAISFASPCDISLLTAEDIAPLIASARNPNPKVREACFRLLPAIGTPEAEECLREALNGPQDETWKAAARALREMELAEVPELLLDLAQQEGQDRRFCLAVLGHFRDPRALPVLIKALHDEDAEVRRTAANALGEQPGEPSEQALREALKDENISVRNAAVWGLSYIGTADSVGPLIGLLRSPDNVFKEPNNTFETSLHKDASYALNSLTGKDFGTDANEWEKWWKEAEADFNMERNLVARLFTPLPPPPEHPFEPQAQAESDPYMKAFSAQGEALRAITSRRNLRALAPELARYLRTPVHQAPIPYLAASVLAEWGYREGIEWLIGFVDEDSGPGNRMFAIRTLGRACRVNFFSDKARWRQWWEANRSRFPEAAPGPN